MIKQRKRNIERLENEKREMEQKRAEKQKKHEEEIDNLMVEHRREMSRQRTTEEDLRKQLIEQKKSQMEMERRLYAEFLDKQSVELEKEKERMSTVAVLKEFLALMKTSNETVDSLKMIKVYCLEGSPESFQADINFELDSIRVLREKIHDQFFTFDQFLLNEPKAHHMTVSSCRSFIAQVKQSMDHEKILGLCGVLPTALENGDRAAIKSFGAYAQGLVEELSLIKNQSKLQIENKTLKELTALSTQEIAIEFLKDSQFQVKTVILLIIIAWILCFCL